MGHRVVTIVVFAALMAAGMPGAAGAENSDIVVRRASQRTNFTNDEISDGFYRTAFRAELQFDRPVERIRKFDEPVRVFVVNGGKPDRGAEIAAIVADIRAHVNHLDVAITTDRARANLLVMLVETSDFGRTIRSRYGATDSKKFKTRCNRSAFRGSARMRAFASGAPRSFFRSTPGISGFAIAPTRNCYRRSGSSTTTTRSPGRCSMTTSRWASSIFTINISQIRSTTLASGPA